MRLRYTAPALADLSSILAFIAERSPRGATRVQARIKAIAGVLLEYPRIGTPTDDPAIRRLVISPYPYLIFYENNDGEIIIHAIRTQHATRLISPAKHWPKAGLPIDAGCR